MIQDKIILFLQNRGWVIAKQNDKFIELAAPEHFGFPEDYTIAIPKSEHKIDFAAFISNIESVIGEIYQLSSDEIEVILEKEQTVFSMRVYDDATQNGRISLTRFDDLLDKVKNILLNAASFVINPDVTNTKIYNEATRYLNLCQFLHTEKGSFVAKIQLPSKEVIIDEDMFNDKPIISEDINSKIEEVLSFVTNSVFKGNFEISDSYVLENEGKLNLKLLKEIESLYDKVDLKNIDFTFSNISDTSVVQSQNVTREQITTLSNFIEGVSDIIFEVVQVEFTGKVLSLKSKDPDGMKNKIELKGLLDNLPFTATASLDSNTYKTAIEAHKYKKYIVIKGVAKKGKTTLKFTDIFDVQLKE